MVKDTKLYDLLGVAPDANEDQIKKGYRKSALKYHPDKPTGDTEKFKEISEAFDILSDPNKRELYNQYGVEAARRGGVPMPDMNGASGAGGPGGMPGGFSGFDFGGQGGAGPRTYTFTSGGPGGAGGGYTPFSAQDAFNIFSNFSSTGGFDEDTGGDDIFSFLGGRRRASGRPGMPGMGGTGGMPGGMGGMPGGMGGMGGMGGTGEKAPPFQIKLPVSLHDLATGTTKKMKIKRKGPSGSQGEKILTVNIKPGWKAGTKITFPNEGDSQRDGSTQDVVFVIEEKPTPGYKRIGDDVEVTLELTLKEALCGFSKIVETLDKKKLKVENKRPVSPGHKIRYPGRGMPISKQPGRSGDLIIHINVLFPDQLTEQQRKAIEDNF